jgi:hypothetical protein
MSGSGALLEAPAYPALDRVRRLQAAGSELGRQLERALDVPLRTYLGAIVPASRRGDNVHRHRLAKAVERYLSERGETDVDTVCEHLLHVPVIQQADHSNLLLDAETFLHNYLFHLANRESGARVAITSQCSTMSGLSRRQPVLGPTFLRTRGALLRVVPLSKTLLKDSSFCCLDTTVPMTFEVLEGDLDVTKDPLLGSLVGNVMDDGPRTYQKINDRIWRRLDLDHEVRRVGIDEAVVSECVALHLEDPDSPITRLLFDAKIRDAFLDNKRRIVESPNNLTVNRATPDFFWYRKGARLHELPETPDAQQLKKGLRNGDFYADRVLAYLVRCILPGVVAVGGVNQQDYLGLYRQMLLDTHRDVPFLGPAELVQAGRGDLTRLGGRPLLEPTGEAMELIRHLGPRTRLRDLEDAYLDRPVGATIGELRCLGPNLTRVAHPPPRG